MVHHGAVGFMCLCHSGFGVDAMRPCRLTLVGGEGQGREELHVNIHIYIYIYIAESCILCHRQAYQQIPIIHAR